MSFIKSSRKIWLNKTKKSSSWFVFINYNPSLLYDDVTDGSYGTYNTESTETEISSPINFIKMWMSHKKHIQ